MIYLLLTIFLNVLISVLFKYFERWRIDHMQAIIVNYWVCVLTGSLFIGEWPLGAQSLQQSWFPIALGLGAGFIGIFNLIAYCTRTQGITAATVANKLSLVIPAALSVWLYGDRLSGGQVFGIILALPAVYLVAKPVAGDNRQVSPRHRSFFWTAVLFLGSGLLDTVMKYAETRLPEDAASQAAFSVHIFAVAGTIGIIILAALFLAGKKIFSWRNLAGGILLGIPNFFSIYCFIRMLNSGFLPGAAAIPLNNVGILLLSALTALLLFREKLTLPRLAGIGLSLVVILLLALA